jgi:O-antigen/teichoic acid export membrane protein
MTTDNQSKGRQIRNGLVYMLPIGLGGLLPLISIPIFTRILSPEDYGVLALAMIYATFMGSLANFGVTIVFERNYFEYQNNKVKLSQLFYSGLLFVLSNFTILAGLTYLFKENISSFLTGSSLHGTLILTSFAGTFFLDIANTFFLTYYKNSEKAKTYTKYKVISLIINFLLTLILVAHLKVGVIGIVYAQLITGFTLFLFLFIQFLKNLPFLLSGNILLEALRISYPLTPRIFLGVLNTQFDKYMISLLATVSGVGVYHIGKNVSYQIFAFMTALENVFVPQVYQRMFNKHKHGSNSIGKYLTPFLYISTFVALGVAVFSEELLTILTPKNYHGAVPIISILAIYMGFLFFGKIPQLLFVKKTHILTGLFIFSLFINIGLNIPFIMEYGAIGAAWATLLAGLISGMINLLVAQYYYKINYEWQKISWIMGIFVIGSITIVSMYLLEIPYHWAILTKAIIVLLFIYLGIRYHIISKDNIRALITAVRLQGAAVA